MSFESWYLQLKFDTLLKPLRSKFGPLEVAELTKIQGEKKNFVIEGVAFQLQATPLLQTVLLTYMRIHIRKY